MSREIHTVAVIGSGVIGASWALLFLSRGLNVIMTDPAPGAEQTFRIFVTEAGANLGLNGDLEQLWKRFEFVDDITPRLPEVDFVQEVT